MGNHFLTVTVGQCLVAPYATKVAADSFRVADNPGVAVPSMNTRAFISIDPCRADISVSRFILVNLGYHLSMSNPAEHILSPDAIHEAGHAVVAAVMGMPDIWM